VALILAALYHQLESLKMSSAIVLLSTVTHALTSTPYTVQLDDGSTDDPNGLNPAQSWRARVFGDVPFNLRVSTDGSDATASDAPVAAELHGITVIVTPNGYVSAVKRGSGADGNVWLSRIHKGA
jgi:hypothetical protein